MCKLFSEPFLLENPPSHFFLPENPDEPEFADWAETNVTATLGSSVFLYCPVINFGDRAMSSPSVSILFAYYKHIFIPSRVIIFYTRGYNTSNFVFISGDMCNLAQGGPQRGGRGGHLHPKILPDKGEFFQISVIFKIFTNVRHPKTKFLTSSLIQPTFMPQF